MLLPAGQFEGKQPAEPLPRSKRQGAARTTTDQKAEWVRAIREGKPEIAWSNFDYAGILTEAMLLGNVAVRLGKPSSTTPTPAGSPTAPRPPVHPARVPRGLDLALARPDDIESTRATITAGTREIRCRPSRSGTLTACSERPPTMPHLPIHGPASRRSPRRSALMTSAAAGQAAFLGPQAAGGGGARRPTPGAGAVAEDGTG